MENEDVKIEESMVEVEATPMEAPMAETSAEAE